jgi:hypothetical protein
MSDTDRDLDWALEAPMTPEKRAWLREEFELGRHRLDVMERTIVDQQALLESHRNVLRALQGEATGPTTTDTEQETG